MRYLRLYAHFLRFSVSRAFEFRVDFYFRIVMDCVYYAVNIGFFAILYNKTGLVGGWTESEAYVFVCGFLLVDAINMTVFANNLWLLPLLINKGDLDYYLVRPVSSLFFVSLREFAANSFLNIVIASGLMVWALRRFPEPLGTVRVVVYLVFLANGVLLTYAIRLAFITPVFWLHSSRGLDELNFSLEHLSERPDQIYAGWVRRILLTVVPFALVASVPAHVLFEGLTVDRALATAGVSVLFCAAAVLFWRRGLRAYSSASS
ncbi:MAG TPA: ABC-2 family transporter protein [Blastocatellia bacterium]|nr:ABC-2 family transporter protein [Blastocatellia bacterium]